MVLRRFGSNTLDAVFSYFRTNAKFLSFQWAAYPTGSYVKASVFVMAINACKANSAAVGGVNDYAGCQHFNTPSAGLACVSTAGACIGVAGGGRGSLPGNPVPVLIQVSHWRTTDPSWTFGVPYGALVGAAPMPQTLYEDGSVEGSFSIASSTASITFAHGGSGGSATISVALSGGPDNNFTGTAPVTLTTVQSSGLTASLGTGGITLTSTSPIASTALAVSASTAGTYTVIINASSPNFPSVTVTIAVTVT
jgi:hypothetical protein